MIDDAEEKVKIGLRLRTVEQCDSLIEAIKTARMVLIKELSRLEVPIQLPAKAEIEL